MKKATPLILVLLATAATAGMWLAPPDHQAPTMQDVDWQRTADESGWQGAMDEFDRYVKDPLAQPYSPLDLNPYTAGIWSLPAAYADVPLPELSDSPSLGDSMFARLQVQLHIAEALDQLNEQGITVTTQTDPQVITLLTSIDAKLQAPIDDPPATEVTLGEASRDAILQIGEALDTLGDDINTLFGPSEPTQ